MALQAQQGLLTGSVSSPGILVTVWDDSGATLPVATAKDHALTVAPLAMFGFPKTQDPSITQLNKSTYRFTVYYKPQNLSTPPAPQREEGTLARRVNFQAQPKHVDTCLQPIGVFGKSGEITDKMPNLKWMVNVQPSGKGVQRVLGTTINPLPESRTLDYYLPNLEVNDAYVDALESLCGKFNSEEFFGKPPGSVQLVRASLSERSPSDWELSLGFAYAAPRFDVDLGNDIVLPELRASYSYWTRTTNEVIDLGGTVGKIIESKVLFAVVQRLVEEGDFAALGLPASVTYPE